MSAGLWEMYRATEMDDDIVVVVGGKLWVG